MMQTIPRWQVTVVFVNSEDNVTIWIYDAHISNVLRQVASMQFNADSLKTPIEITVGPRYD